MAYEKKEGQGVLFTNNKRTSENAPIMKGDILIGGKLYSLAAWSKVTRNGEKMLSLQAELPQAQPQSQEAPQQQQSASAPKPQAQEDNDLPFK